MILGLKYQRTYNIEPTLSEFRLEYQSYLKGKEDKEYAKFLSSLTPWGRLKEVAANIARKNDIHPSVIVSMAALESGRGTSYFATARNNYLGLGAYDKNPNLAFSFSSPGECFNYFVSLMKNDTRYRLAWQNRKDPYKMIEEIKKAGYASSPTYVQKITSMPEFKEFL